MSRAILATKAKPFAVPSWACNMYFLRTANAGGLLTLDGVRILLDGVCEEIAPYQKTPDRYFEMLQENVPDAVGFTHLHPDHFHSDYLSFYEKSGKGITVLPTDSPATTSVGSVSIAAIPTRHIGKAERGLLHSSFLLRGSKRILFVGDASPANWLNTPQEIKADVLIAPFAYLTTNMGLRTVSSLGVKDVILVHMPGENPDAYGIWKSVMQIMENPLPFRVQIPEIGEQVLVL